MSLLAYMLCIQCHVVHYTIIILYDYYRFDHAHGMRMVESIVIIYYSSIMHDMYTQHVCQEGHTSSQAYQHRPRLVIWGDDFEGHCLDCGLSHLSHGSGRLLPVVMESCNAFLGHNNYCPKKQRRPVRKPEFAVEHCVPCQFVLAADGSVVDWARDGVVCNSFVSRYASTQPHCDPCAPHKTRWGIESLRSLADACVESSMVLLVHPPTDTPSTTRSPIA